VFPVLSVKLPNMILSDNNDSRKKPWYNISLQHNVDTPFTKLTASQGTGVGKVLVAPEVYRRNLNTALPVIGESRQTLTLK